MSDEQRSLRRRFTAQQKVAVLKEHLVEKVPVSQVCDNHGINPTAFYRWQKEFFENGAAAFEGRSPKADGRARQLEERVEKLSAKLARKARRQAERACRAPENPPLEHGKPSDPDVCRETDQSLSRIGLAPNSG